MRLGRRSRRRTHRCSAGYVRFDSQAQPFALVVCDANCGWWEATLRGEVYAVGWEGLWVNELEELQQRLRADGRADVADELLQVYAEL